MEMRDCKSCEKGFEIQEEDFEFYEKIDVPTPTWCPDCRLIRRMVWINERSLHQRACDKCGKDIVSNYFKTAPHPVYCSKCWWSDEWDPDEYARDYDFSRPFFEQFRELYEAVPWPALHVIEPSMVDSPYTHISSYLKNCYMVVNSDYSEDSAFSTYIERSKKVLDLTMADLVEFSYESFNVQKGSKIFYSQDIHDGMDIYFSKNLRGCSHCFGCVNLRNKKYHFFNEPYSKEEYFKKLAEYDLGSHEVVEQAKREAREHFLKFSNKATESGNNTDSEGEYITNSKNVTESYGVDGGEDCKYCHFLFLAPTKDSYDYTMWGMNATRMYECIASGGGARDIKFAFECWANGLTNLEYCMDLFSRCDNLFGCIGVQGKSFCILNKQYSEGEYNEMVGKIKEQMKKDGEYGEFFPISLSPFPYNETIAQDYFPLTKEEALSKGFLWRDTATRNYAVTKTATELEDNVNDVGNEILDDVIRCAHIQDGETICNERCTTAFRITPQEFEFYKEMNIPLPRVCPNCRHARRIRGRRGMVLHHRTCQKCDKSVESSFGAADPDTIYCESCYNQEVA